jgi:hypothetical protein
MLSVCRLCLDLDAFLVLTAEGDLDEFFPPDPARILGRPFLSWVDAHSRTDLAHALLASSRQAQSRVIPLTWIGATGGRKVSIRLCPEGGPLSSNRIEIVLESVRPAASRVAA